MRRTTLALVSLLTFALSPSARAHDIGSFRFEARQGAHRATLILKTKAFDPSRHRVKLKKVGELLLMTVDGRVALGAEDGTPSVEIESFRFVLDGREVRVPRRLYSDCFDPSTEAGGLALKFGQDAGSVFVFMQGSDGAGVYDVVWVLRADGRHSRWANEGGDCSLFNFYCGLDGLRQ
jgi:hypothetical protein